MCVCVHTIPAMHAFYVEACRMMCIFSFCHEGFKVWAQVNGRLGGKPLFPTEPSHQPCGVFFCLFVSPSFLCVLPTHTSIHLVSIQCLRRSEKGVRSPRQLESQMVITHHGGARSPEWGSPELGWPRLGSPRGQLVLFLSLAPCICFWNRISCHLGWSQTLYMAEFYLELLVLLLLPPWCWDYRHVTHAQFILCWGRPRALCPTAALPLSAGLFIICIFFISSDFIYNKRLVMIVINWPVIFRQMFHTF